MRITNFKGLMRHHNLPTSLEVSTPNRGLTASKDSEEEQRGRHRAATRFVEAFKAWW